MAENGQEQNFTDITGKCFINAPFEQLHSGDLSALFLENNLQPEVGLEGDCLWDVSTFEFKAVAARFHDKGLSCTVHAPFFDLSPGGFDKRVVAVTREKLGRALEVAELFQARAMVCHLGFEENKHRGKFDRWLATALETWQQLLENADRQHTRIMFENTYETSPDVHKRLFTELNADGNRLGFCMDTGHLSAFAGTSWQPWLAELDPWLAQLHLHDNDGAGDSHIALGQGIFNFKELFDFLGREQLRPLLTLEPHSREDLWLSLAYIRQTGLF